MTAAAYIDGEWRCYSLDGRTRHYLSCRHETPRDAIAHTSESYVSPRRSTEAPTADPVTPPSGVGSGLGASVESRKLLTG